MVTENGLKCIVAHWMARQNSREWTPGLGESKDASWYGDLVFEQ